jgi:hypothetical protein
MTLPQIKSLLHRPHQKTEFAKYQFTHRFLSAGWSQGKPRADSYDERNDAESM